MYPRAPNAGLSAGVNNGGGNWTLSQSDLAGLGVRPIENNTTGFNLTVTAQARETSNGDTSSITGFIQVQVFDDADAPIISEITDKETNEDSSTGAISFTVTDADTPIGSVTVWATSDNQTLVPNSNIVLGGSGESRTITVMPAANQFGLTTITIHASDDGARSFTETFKLTVNSVNDAPTISAIADQIVNEDSSTGAISFMVDDVDHPVTSLTVTATSSNQTLIPNNNIGLGGSGASRTISVSPANNQFGTATVTVTVSDGISTSKAETFLVTVNPMPDAPTISAIADRNIQENESTGIISFTVSDPDVPPEQIVVTATSSNQTIIPNANIVLGGTGSVRTINVTPAPFQNGGPVTITVTVNDSGATGGRDLYRDHRGGQQQRPS